MIARPGSRKRILLAATVVAVGVFAGGLCWRLISGRDGPSGGGAGHSLTSVAFVGSETCAGCHQTETRLWRTSHHKFAMDHATDTSVLGDFSGATFTYYGVRSRFFRKDGKFLVETDRPDGKLAVFVVKYTFGVYPLQQYLVEFPDGRLQALGIAWDSRPKDQGGQRWFHLYPNEEIRHDDILHWTKLSQNWNYMCAECHSTEVRKNYDASSNSFRTSLSEISVGCESCHGPGAAHLAWAKSGSNPRVANKGFTEIYARRPAPNWAPDPSTGTPKQGMTRPDFDEVELCAHCHARRSQIGEGWRPGHPLADTHLPVLLTPDLFEDDGQMKDEVFNDHSFKQSLMYAKGVTCGDCHDPHSGKLKAVRADVCSQCHQPARFAAASHTGHASEPGSPDCISCHMPTRVYMIIDARHDHSFRIPRPDLSAKFGTSNACNDCHKDQTAAWAAEAIKRLHGPLRKGRRTWAEAFHRARAGEPAARELLLKLVNDSTTPAVARATAIFEGQRFPSIAMGEATERALGDADPLVRIAALRSLSSQPFELRWRRAGPLLSDAVKAVRIEAATLLSDQKEDSLAQADRVRLESAWNEYEATQRLNADRPEGHANLGVFFLRRGRPDNAEAEYLAGLKLDPTAAPIYVNLADLYRLQDRETEAEQLLRRAISLIPSAASVRHALGLSLVRQKRYQEAIEQLGRTVELAPEESRYSYVYIVALQSSGRRAEARAALDQALRRHPFGPNLLQLELQEALRVDDTKRAAPIARMLSDLWPDDPEIARLASWLDNHQ